MTALKRAEDAFEDQMASDDNMPRDVAVAVITSLKFSSEILDIHRWFNEIIDDILSERD